MSAPQPRDYWQEFADMLPREARTLAKSPNNVTSLIKSLRAGWTLEALVEYVAGDLGSARVPASVVASKLAQAPTVRPLNRARPTSTVAGPCEGRSATEPGCGRPTTVRIHPSGRRCCVRCL